MPHYVKGLVGVFILAALSAPGCSAPSLLITPVSGRRALVETELMREGIKNVRDRVVGSIPMQRIGSPEDIANAVAYLCSERGGYLTGQLISPSGGMWMP